MEQVVAKSKRKAQLSELSRDPLPEMFGSLDEAGAFWDTHSSADYEDAMEDVDVEIDRVRVAAA